MGTFSGLRLPTVGHIDGFSLSTQLLLILITITNNINHYYQKIYRYVLFILSFWVKSIQTWQNWSVWPKFGSPGPLMRPIIHQRVMLEGLESPKRPHKLDYQKMYQ